MDTYLRPLYSKDTLPTLGREAMIKHSADIAIVDGEERSPIVQSPEITPAVSNSSLGTSSWLSETPAIFEDKAMKATF